MTIRYLNAECPDCYGSGVLDDELCPTCRGRSAAPTKEHTMDEHFTFVRYAEEGQFAGQCDCGWEGRPRGSYMLAAIDSSRHCDENGEPLIEQLRRRPDTRPLA